MSTITPYLDYSQTSKWNFCRWAWYERYVNKRVKGWPKDRQRDDALCIGSLVHAGLENWYKHGVPEIPEEAIAQYTPTPEALGLAREMVYGYPQAYPMEPWELVRCEEPLRFPLVDGCDGLAKIDLYFYIPEDCTIETGVPGYTNTLTRGWWVQEYKTKGQGKDVAKWIQGWENNLQADFQMMALTHHLSQQTRQIERAGWAVDGEGSPYNESVQGVLVNVIERPSIYVPRRTCKGCHQVWPFRAYLPTGTGKYRCPNCGHEQPLKPLEESASKKTPTYYRVIVTRTPAQLAAHKAEMVNIALQMQDYRAVPLDYYCPNRESCVDKRWDRECEYFGPHTYDAQGQLRSTSDPFEGYEVAEDYVKEAVEVDA
jgi:hypothetical protein